MSRKIISCSNCAARFDVTDPAQFKPGSKIRCGRCHSVLWVPDDGPVVAPVKPQAPRPAQQTARSVPVAGRTGGAPQSQKKGPPVLQPTGQVAPPAAARQAPSPPTETSPIDAPGQDRLLGAVLNSQYRLVKKLGEGGYGAVYEAKDVNLERRVAIKVMLQSRAQSREYVAKFLREARTAAQLTHTNVVSVHGVGFDPEMKVHFLAMEFVQGRTIHDILQEKGPMSVEEAVDYIVQSCKGLQAAHERNIIHRDIKPGNLMVTPQGVLKITDFGLAKIYDEGAAQSTVIGTPYFMPPEQFEGKAKDGRTDIYALGVTFYYMLTMQRAHSGSGPAQILLSVMTKEAKSILEHRPELPEGLWAVVRRMIHRDLDKRYQNCNEIISDLMRLTGKEEEEEEKVWCPECGAGNAVDAETCASCKASLQEHCPVCNEVDAAGTKFCGNCGSNIPLERAVAALADEGKALLAKGRIDKAREKIQQALERSPQNLVVASLLRDLEARREAHDAYRDAIRDLLSQGRAQDALERFEAARKEFPESPDIGSLEGDVRTALTARDATASPVEDSIAAARRLEADGRIRDALVAWRGVLVLAATNEDAVAGEARTRRRVEEADELAAAGAASLAAGDPESARDTLRRAAELVPKDPVIEGRLRAAEHAAAEIEADLAAATKELAAGQAAVALSRLRGALSRARASKRVSDAIQAAERKGREASAGAVRDRAAKAIARAEEHEKAKRLRDAADAWRDAASVDPEAPGVQDAIARVDRALAEFEAMVGQSRGLLSSGDPEGALASAEKAVALFPDSPDGKGALSRAKTAWETLRHEAERIRNSIGQEADDEEGESVLQWARELQTRYSGSKLATEVLREVEQASREADEKASESRAKAALARAEKLERERQYERAVAAYEDAILHAPGDERARKAAAALKQRLADGNARRVAAEEKLGRGDPAGAREDAEAALELLPDHIETKRVLAGAKTALDEIERAAESIEEHTAEAKALAQQERLQRLSVKYPGSAKCASLAATALKIVEGARAAARRGKVDSLVQSARAALEGKRLADARRIAGEVLALSPDEAAAKAVIEGADARAAAAAAKLDEGRAAAATGRHEEAIELFAAALDGDPSLDEAAKLRDRSQAAIEKAREALRKAIADAQNLDRARRPREARTAWQKVAELDPESRAKDEIARIDAFLEKASAEAARVRGILEQGDPEEAVAAAQEARAALGAWEDIEELQREARTAADELDREIRKAEKLLAAADGDGPAARAAADAVLARWKGSERAKDLAARAAAYAETQRNQSAAAEMRRLVRERRFDDAVALSDRLRAEGVTGSEFALAEQQARKMLSELKSLQAEVAKHRAEGRIDEAKSAVQRMLAVHPDDPTLKASLLELEETDREYAAHLDAAERARRRGQLTESLDHYREALAINSASKDATERAALVEEQMRRRAEMLAACRTAIAEGDGERCSEAAKSLVELFPEDDDAADMHRTGESMRNIVGSLLAYAKRQRAAGDAVAAKQALECVLRVAPKHAEASSLLASI